MSIDVIWWESSITDHQLHTLKELSCLQGINLRVHALKSESNDRKRQGWTSSDLSLVNGEVFERRPILFILRTFFRRSNAVHIFGGPFDSFLITFALFISLILGKRTFVLTEPFSPISAGLLEDNWRSMFPFVARFRAIKHRILWMLVKVRVDGIFAVSKLAVSQLERFGVQSKKIFPFGYFVPAINRPSAIVSRNDSEVLRLIFVGTINSTKGIDLAVNAIDAFNRSGQKVILDVYGPGDVGRLELPKSGVSFKGLIEFGNSQSVIAGYDCLILPSRYDGWGVTVNEALLAGVPVICSRQVGASVLVEKWGCGAVFDHNIKGSFVKVISELCDERVTLLKEWRVNAEYVINIISPFVAAQYIADVLFDRLDEKTNGISITYQ